MSEREKTLERRTENRHILLRILQTARPIRWWLLLGCLLAMVVIICALAGPKLMGNLVQQLYDYWAAYQSGAGAADLPAALVPGLLCLLGVYGVHSLFTYFKMLLLNNVVSRYFTCNLRIMISDKLQRLPVSYIDGTPVGEILHRMTDDVSRMGNTVHEIVDTLMSGFLQTLAISVVMLLEDWRLALMVILIMPLSIKLSALVAEKSNVYFREMHKQSGKLYSVVEESYTNYATTRAYNMEDYNGKRHEEVNLLQQKAEAKANFLGSIVQPVISFSNALIDFFLAAVFFTITPFVQA